MKSYLRKSQLSLQAQKLELKAKVIDTHSSSELSYREDLDMNKLPSNIQTIDIFSDQSIFKY